MCVRNMISEILDKFLADFKNNYGYFSLNFSFDGGESNSFQDGVFKFIHSQTYKKQQQSKSRQLFNACIIY